MNRYFQALNRFSIFLDNIKRLLKLVKGLRLTSNNLSWYSSEKSVIHSIYTQYWYEINTSQTGVQLAVLCVLTTTILIIKCLSQNCTRLKGMSYKDWPRELKLFSQEDRRIGGTWLKSIKRVDKANPSQYFKHKHCWCCIVVILEAWLEISKRVILNQVEDQHHY